LIAAVVAVGPIGALCPQLPARSGSRHKFPDWPGHVSRRRELGAAQKLAMKEIVEQAASPAGRSTWSWGDDASDPTQAINEARRLVTRKESTW